MKLARGRWSMARGGRELVWRGLLLLTMTLACAGQARAATDFLDDESYKDEEGAFEVYDPIEPFNRVMFTFNDRLFLWVLNPVATGYSQVLPADIRGSIAHFFDNLGEPIRSVNCLLQGRFRDSGRALGRFVINSTCGVFGFADPATNEFQLAPVHGTMGGTLATWGIGDGLYLVVPLFGPSTLRDFSGSLLDSMAMSSYYPWNDDTLTMSTAYGTNTVNRLSFRLGQYEELKKLSFDPYVAFRNGYFQMREKMRGSSDFFVPVTKADVFDPVTK